MPSSKSLLRMSKSLSLFVIVASSPVVSLAPYPPPRLLQPFFPQPPPPPLLLPPPSFLPGTLNPPITV